MPYSVDGTAYSVWVPAVGATPNFLFYSCNGETGADSGAVKFAEKSASVRCLCLDLNVSCGFVTNVAAI